LFLSDERDASIIADGLGIILFGRSFKVLSVKIALFFSSLSPVIYLPVSYQKTFAV